jgi:hypothetical protein
VAWSTPPKLLIFLPTFQFVLMYSPQLLYLFEELKFQAMVLLYLIGFPLVCAPPLVPHLQLIPFVYQYHQLLILSPIVKVYVLFLNFRIWNIMSSSFEILWFFFLFLLCNSTAFSHLHFVYWILWFQAIWNMIYKGWKSFFENR